MYRSYVPFVNQREAARRDTSRWETSPAEIRALTQRFDRRGPALRMQRRSAELPTACWLQ
jgi:hypothetical protein